mgnify:CR=1 FL=1
MIRFLKYFRYKNALLINEKSTLIRSKAIYRSFMISFTLIFYMAFGCGLYPQFTSFGRIFYTLDTSFQLWLYLSFIAILFIFVIVFLVVSSVKKVFAKGWILFYFVFMNLFFFLLFSLNAYLFVGFILTKTGCVTPFSPLLFVFDFPLVVIHCHLYLFFARNVKEVLIAKRKAFLDNDTELELSNDAKREKEKERDFSLLLFLSFVFAVLTYCLGLYPQVLGYKSIFSFQEGAIKASIFLAIISVFIIVGILLSRLSFLKKALEKRWFLYFLFGNFILAISLLLIPHIFPGMIIVTESGIIFPSNPIGIIFHVVFGLATLFFYCFFIRKIL